MPAPGSPPSQKEKLMWVRGVMCGGTQRHIVIKLLPRQQQEKALTGRQEEKCKLKYKTLLVKHKLKYKTPSMR